VDHDVGHPGPHVHERLHLRAHAEVIGVGERADDGEGRQVHHDRRQAGLLDRFEAGVHHLA
jgi:hypothetical protein